MTSQGHRLNVHHLEAMSQHLVWGFGHLILAKTPPNSLKTRLGADVKPLAFVMGQSCPASHELRGYS